jgi:hypothetical protein
MENEIGLPGDASPPGEQDEPGLAKPHGEI